MTGYYTGTGTTPEGAGITGLAARPKIGFLRRGYDAIDIGIFVWAYSSFCQGMVGLYGSGTSLYTTACQWYVCYADAYSTSFQTYQSSGDTRKNLN
jgi:hypothetical protein